MQLTFEKKVNRYTAVGQFGTCYTITEDTSDTPTLYYVDNKNVEFYTLFGAKDYCQALEDAEDEAHYCCSMGVRAFGGGCCDETDIRYTAIDEVAYIYCPTATSAQAFIRFTEYCVDCFCLSHATDRHSDTGTLYKYNAHSDAFDMVDSDICNIISQLIK